MGQIIAFPSRPVAPTMVCALVAGTRVASPRGWGPVEDVAAGETVMTLESGMRMVRHVEIRPAIGATLVHVPGGVLGNEGSLLLLPGQMVQRGEGGTPVRAESLVGRSGIGRWMSRAPALIVTLHFAETCGVFANLGAVLSTSRAACQTGTGRAAPLIPFRAQRRAAPETA